MDPDDICAGFDSVEAGGHRGRIERGCVVTVHTVRAADEPLAAGTDDHGAAEARGDIPAVPDQREIGTGAPIVYRLAADATVAEKKDLAA